MRLMRTVLTAAIIAALAAPLQAAVFVTVLNEQREDTPAGTRVIQPVTIASENATYTLNYDIIVNPDTPGEITSHWWQWNQGYVTLGMTGPSNPNFYWQGFIRWTFDDESLHTRPAEMRVIRESGQDGMIEYTWDTPVVRASLRFAMVSGSDKLLMFGSYEPKQPVENVRLQFAIYPATFEEPRNRRVTTALATREPGTTIDLDLERERWVLFEDVTEGRPASGSAGMLIGTPESIESITIPVSEYGIVPTIALPPGGGSFALGLYDFPTLPDPMATRAYFARSADTEAAQIAEMAAGDLDQPLPAMPMDRERLAALLEQGVDMLDRPAETWRPDPEPLDFPWAANIPGEPIDTVIFCRRWCAWETMELARRLEMDARHLYFDGADVLVNATAWPYRNQTGIGPLPAGIAAREAATLASDEGAELFLCAGVTGNAIPGVARAGLAERVADGAGLLLVGNAGVRNGWPEELFANEDPGLAEIALRGFAWDQVPGYREGERGRTSGPPVQAWRYGQGRVVHLNVNLNTYSSLVPRNDAFEGLDAATDHCLAIAARVALAAAGREMTTDTAGVASFLVRMQDDLGRVLMLQEQESPARYVTKLTRPHFIDMILRNAAGETVGFTSEFREPEPASEITDLAISPSTVTAEPAPPWVDLPAGGEVQCSATVADPPEGARLQWTIRDIFDRVVARQTTPAQTNATSTVELPRPLTPAHVLDVALTRDGEELAFERLRFTMTVPYRYDDFTALMWSYAGGDPVLQRTDRMCYEWGADMSDLCHMGGYSDAGAAREYSVSARSGLRLIPYVTRIAGEANEQNERVPCLHDPELWARLSQSLTTTCRQAAPYSPAAYTLGDENYLFRGSFECCHTPESIATYRRWLQERYRAIEALNAEWATRYRSFEEIERPMILEEAAAQSASFAPWIDHKLFMDRTFAWAHDECAGYVQAQDPGAKVGWDGLLSYSWRAGYDFEALTRNLALNQTYTGQWLEGELYRSFKRDDALTGKWGNAVADSEEGFHAHPWDCLLAGDNSVWWWTSWGCDYIPFNPDLSQSNFGRWFFEAVRETSSGPGRLLLNAGRQESPIAVLYSQRDLFAAAVLGQMVENQPFAPDNRFLEEHQGLLRALRDLGYQYRHVSSGQLEAGISTEDYRVLVLPLATCLSDAQVEAIREFVEAGGTLLVDGRAGLLSGQGRIRKARALDEVLGLAGEAGLDGLTRPAVAGNVAVSGSIGDQAIDTPEFDVVVLEPEARATTATALAEVGGAPVVAVNELGSGRVVTLNFALNDYNSERSTEGPKPRLAVLDAVVRAAGITPPAELARADGERPLCVQQVLFGDGPARYLALQEDILVRTVPEQQVRVTLPEPAIVYDLRAGERVGDGPVGEWDTTVARGEPQVFSLLPYEVTAVEVQCPDQAHRGGTASVLVAVRVSEGRPGDHVVRLDVYAPHSDRPHRQYSQNILVAGDEGSPAEIPFALNDARGQWRLVFRDVATGVSTERTMAVQ